MESDAVDDQMTFSRIAEGGFPRNRLLILLLELKSTTSALKTRRVGKSVKKVLSTRAAVFLSFSFPLILTEPSLLPVCIRLPQSVCLFYPISLQH